MQHDPNCDSLDVSPAPFAGAKPCNCNASTGAPDQEVSLEEWLAATNAELRRAGCELAKAALHVAATHDGIHRLMLATANWAQAIADEGGRGDRHATRPAPPEQVPAPRGFHHDRTEVKDATGRLEAALAAAWAEQCEPKSWLNYGHGTLQNLFCKRGVFHTVDMHHRVTESEAMVAATVVQWLGTNCGRGMLDVAFRRAGWRLEMRPPPGE